MQISPTSFKLLKDLAIPLEDTVDTVIERLVSFYKEHCHEEVPAPPRKSGATPAGVINFNADAPPDLRYTRIIKAQLGTQDLRDTNWNELVRKAIEAAYIAARRDFNKLRQMTTANITKGQKVDEGYTPIADLEISVQGVPANDAFRIARELAKKLSLPLHVIFEWREKEGATHPGEAGQFIIK